MNLCLKMKNTDNIHPYVSNASLNIEKQMIIPFNISAKFEIMGYEKLSKFFTFPNFNRLLYCSFPGHF